MGVLFLLPERLAHIRARADLRIYEQFVNFSAQNYEPFISILLPIKAIV